MTVFLRALEAKVDDKEAALRAGIAAVRTGAATSVALYERDPRVFSAVPGSPFAYWVSDAIREIFGRCERFEGAGRTVKQGLATADDFRFVRAAWEIPEAGLGKKWFGFAKGGAFSPYYADIHLCVNWEDGGAEIKNNLNMLGAIRSNVWMLTDTATKYFFRPGLTWPLRGIRYSAQAVPANCIFSVAGKMAFAPEHELATSLAVFNCHPFDFLINTRAGKVGGVQYEVGLIQSTPIPSLTDEKSLEIANLAHRAWSLKRSLDTVNETSHAFVLPPGLNERVANLAPASIRRALETVQTQIDNSAFALYKICAVDRAFIEDTGKQRPTEPETNAAAIDEATDAEDAHEPVAEESSGPTDATDALGSWLVGVAFGRFDRRLATRAREVAAEPGPFDFLPARSPGMFPAGEFLVDSTAILVDDDGHAHDLATRVQAVAQQVDAEAPTELRDWLAKSFFCLHLKMYSRSKRKAPIYWQLATPSVGYSVWLYLHAFNNDTLFRVQNDYVAPKLALEERRLDSLKIELGATGTTAQRKAVSAQELLVEELRAMLNEVRRVAPLWHPNLDDGVVINFAPLWRLVPQHKAWQKELKATWDALCAGKYDWAYLAMHLWPERVVPKCAKDRSLAIAHGLEDVFWAEGTDGKWAARKTPTRSVDELVRERTSPAVKSALKSLLEAPPPSGSAKTIRKGKSNA